MLPPATLLPATTIMSDIACATAIERIGWIKRQLTDIETRHAHVVAVAKAAAEAAATPLLNECTVLEDKVAAWCNQERDRLTRNKATGTAEFASGIVHWRKGRDTIDLDDSLKDKIVAALKKMRLSRFIKKTEAPSKQKMHGATEAERVRLAKIKGVTFVKGEEAFSIIPAGAELAERAPEAEAA